MEKELVINWLQKCSDKEDDAVCPECPFDSCEDCVGALMKAAADVIEGK